jgi:hypothetical protein
MQIFTFYNIIPGVEPTITRNLQYLKPLTQGGIVLCKGLLSSPWTTVGPVRLSGLWKCSLLSKIPPLISFFAKV